MSRASRPLAYRDKCVDALRESGARITRPRMAVIGCLADSCDALSPREIADTITADRAAPRVDQVSIYRVLEILSRLGLVHQVYPSGGFVACTHIGCQSAFHALTRCEMCQNTEEIDIPESIMTPLRRYLGETAGFTATGQILQIDGTCRACG